MTRIYTKIAGYLWSLAGQHILSIGDFCVDRAIAKQRYFQQ